MLKEKFDAKVLQKYRELLFPALGLGILTGYNIYKDKIEGKSLFVVSYLHSDLSVSKSGKVHPHLEELIDKLSKFGPPKIIENISSSITDRIVVYMQGDWEENPKNLTFYTLQGEKINPEILKDYKGVLIAEWKQYDLSLEIENEKDLAHLLDLYNEYLYAYHIDRKGKMHFNAPNPHAIRGSWEIPLIIVSAKQKFRRKDLLRTWEISVKEGHYEMNAIVRKQLKNLRTYLQNKNLDFKEIKKFVNRPFVEIYLDLLNQARS